MKYQQPYGTAENAPYINGNPATGTQGSIPPAAAFEQPLRELAALISNAGFTPSDSDLAQVTRAVRQGINFLTATAIGGNPNNLAASFTGGPPAIATYMPGLRLNVAIPANNTGPVSISIDGLPSHLIKRASGADLAADDLRGGMVAELVYDGTNFQLVNFQGFTSSTTNNNTFTVNIPYIADTGTVNAINAPFSPAITSLPAGLLILVKLANTLTGPSTIVVNAQPAKAITRVDSTPTQLNDAFIGEMCLLAYDGTKFQIVNQTGVPAIPTLIAPQTFWVNKNTGSDSNDGRAATVGGGHGPFATINRGVLETLKYNMNGYDQTINVANQTYNERVLLSETNGAGTVKLVGNTGTPDSVVIQAPSGRHAVFQTGGSYSMDGFKLIAGNPPSVSGDAMDCLDMDGGDMVMMNISFGTAQRSHMQVNFDAHLIVAYGTIKIAGNATQHIATSGSGVAQYGIAGGNWPFYTIPAGVNFEQFAESDSAGYMNIRFSSVTGSGNVSGPKYFCDLNGVIAAAGDENYLPGSSAGSTDRGGQYAGA